MKTKSYLFAAASATLMLASCTQNEVVEMPATRAIGFGTYVGNTSRAAAEDTSLDFLKDADKGNGFYVFGSYAEDSKEVVVFNGVSSQSHVIYNGSAWGYSPMNYWSVGKKYTFAAYGPAAALNNGTASFNYTANTLSITGFEATGNLDLVVAEGKNAGYTLASETATPEMVDFKFFHALSKVRFTFKNGWRNLVTLKVSDVKLTGAKRTGDLVTTGTLAAATAPFALEKWSNQAVKTDGNDYTWKKENGDDDTFSSTTTDESYPYEYFLMPQTLVADAIKLTFTCQVTNDQGSGPELGGPGTAGQPVDVSVTIPVTTNVSAWEPGKAYNYTLTIDGDLFGLKPIQFDAVDVVTWENVDEKLDNKNLTD